MPIINGVHYHASTQGTGETLLLLHGFTGRGDNWAHLFPLLTPHYQVVTLDLLGHGNTDSPPHPTRYHMTHLIDDVMAFCDTLHATKIHLLGYSMGGRVALACAIHAPSRFASLILESASAGLADETARQERVYSDTALAERILTGGIEAFINEWEALPLWHTQATLAPEARHRLRQQRLKNNTLGLANSLIGYGTGAQPSYWDKLHTLTSPTLLMVGEEDRKFVATLAKMQQHLPNVQQVVIPNAGHTTHLEAPQVFAEAVLSFLSGLDLTDRRNV